mmetsp:Transcript_5183/g.11497  ORF Transcript_5183/g.11497 Transcript_5183/m.11497 type:complete len:567 (-) Transcript_5183:1541-3241(-)|eukprot:CAMPEP_0168186728 /NCGR_PEP_ID=MMETSP0139_2-20121125/14606_1 /TAXON_ID=44445 /ORGANISM="Pseudo-nitzschia australis, Strain 10249 10 AB" /LENGTH=566 /DNA_ID=CAMNT_0008108793 /DNA_START=147 /DNA_END=1847 /DNA_ORIENTATION=+
MGNTCCKTSNQDATKNSTQTNGTGNGSKNNAISNGDVNNKNRPFGFERGESAVTVFYDAMDHFPNHESMSYPPANSMRSLAFSVDMQQPKTLRRLLNSNSRRLLPSSELEEEEEEKVDVAAELGKAKNILQRQQRASVTIISDCLSKEAPGSQGKGYPGELTESELATCLEFREKLKTKNPAYKEIVMAMHPHEQEAFALCRFLRARDFDAENVFAMLEEDNQAVNWRTTKNVDFYSDFHTAIPEFNGCPLSVLMSQFPLIHSGIGKNGAIIMYVKAGEINCPGIECIVGDMVNAMPFCWNRLYHGARDAMEREIARSDPSSTMVLAEKIMIIDLKGNSALFSTGYDFLKATPQAGSCFPETSNRTYILNAPFSFSVVWAAAKQIMDARTVQKIGFFSTNAKAKSDFMKHIDSNELLSNYGGAGESFEEILAKRQKELAHKEGIVRYVVKHLAMNGKQLGFGFDLSSDETVDSIVVYSRSDNMCKISVADSEGNCVVEGTAVHRKQATNRANFRKEDGYQSRNNYALEIASYKDFAKVPAGSFVVNTTKGKRGDHFLVAVSIAEKK